MNLTIIVKMLTGLVMSNNEVQEIDLDSSTDYLN